MSIDQQQHFSGIEQAIGNTLVTRQLSGYLSITDWQNCLLVSTGWNRGFRISVPFVNFKLRVILSLNHDYDRRVAGPCRRSRHRHHHHRDDQEWREWRQAGGDRVRQNRRLEIEGAAARHPDGGDYDEDIGSLSLEWEENIWPCTTPHRYEKIVLTSLDQVAERLAGFPSFRKSLTVLIVTKEHKIIWTQCPLHLTTIENLLTTHASQITHLIVSKKVGEWSKTAIKSKLELLVNLEFVAMTADSRYILPVNSPEERYLESEPETECQHASEKSVEKSIFISHIPIAHRSGADRWWPKLRKISLDIRSLECLQNLDASSIQRICGDWKVQIVVTVKNEFRAWSDFVMVTGNEYGDMSLSFTSAYNFATDKVKSKIEKFGWFRQLDPNFTPTFPGACSNKNSSKITIWINFWPTLFEILEESQPNLKILELQPFKIPPGFLPQNFNFPLVHTLHLNDCQNLANPSQQFFEPGFDLSQTFPSLTHIKLTLPIASIVMTTEADCVPYIQNFLPPMTFPGNKMSFLTVHTLTLLDDHENQKRSLCVGPTSSAIDLIGRMSSVFGQVKSLTVGKSKGWAELLPFVWKYFPHLTRLKVELDLTNYGSELMVGSSHDGVDKEVRLRKSWDEFFTGIPEDQCATLRDIEDRLEINLTDFGCRHGISSMKDLRNLTVVCTKEDDHVLRFKPILTHVASFYGFKLVPGLQVTFVIPRWTRDKREILTTLKDIRPFVTLDSGHD